MFTELWAAVVEVDPTIIVDAVATNAAIAQTQASQAVIIAIVSASVAVFTILIQTFGAIWLARVAERAKQELMAGQENNNAGISELKTSTTVAAQAAATTAEQMTLIHKAVNSERTAMTDEIRALTKQIEQMTADKLKVLADKANEDMVTKMDLLMTEIAALKAGHSINADR